jgi:hypothetical protein
MSNMHHTRLGFLPFRQPSALSRNITTLHHYQPSHQNVIIGNGMMTVRTNSQYLPVQYQITYTQVAEPNQVSHSISSRPLTASRPWDSAGTIIIEDKYRDFQGNIYQAIFLGLNPITNKYELFYGKRDSSDISPIETARRESCEESANLFRFSSKVFNYTYCVISPNKRHYAFVIRVQSSYGGIQSKIFNHNLNILKLVRAPHSWTELSKITRIGINQAISFGILNHPNKRDFYMSDVYGNSITIFSRDAEFIRDAIKAKMNMNSPIHSIYHISSYDDKFNGNKHQFLNSTGCYID